MKKQNRFEEICHRYKVRLLYAFGSSLTDGFKEKSSDIDHLVELKSMDPIEHGEYLINFWDELEQLFSRKVDLLTESSVTNPVLRKRIDETKTLIYDGRGKEIPA